MVHKVWDRTENEYRTQDKYKGREIKAEEFRSVLSTFLNDGSGLMVYHIPGILQKLYALAEIVNRLVGYRFYGCSLLFIYDGDPEAQDTCRAYMSDRPSSRKKRGESLERRRRDSKSAARALRRVHSADAALNGALEKTDGEDGAGEGTTGASAGSPVRGTRRRGEVNVRIVDFAHTTTGRDYVVREVGSSNTNIAPQPSSGAGANAGSVVASGKGYQADIDPDSGLIVGRFPPHYPEQPDRGFLFGLKNLAEALERLWDAERVRRMKVSSRRDADGVAMAMDPGAVARQLAPLNTDGKAIFEEIFGQPGVEDLGYIST